MQATIVIAAALVACASSPKPIEKSVDGGSGTACSPTGDLLLELRVGAAGADEITRIYRSRHYSRTAADGRKVDGCLAPDKYAAIQRVASNTTVAMEPPGPVCAGLPGPLETLVIGTAKAAWASCVSRPHPTVYKLVALVAETVPLLPPAPQPRCSEKGQGLATLGFGPPGTADDKLGHTWVHDTGYWFRQVPPDTQKTIKGCLDDAQLAELKAAVAAVDLAPGRAPACTTPPIEIQVLYLHGATERQTRGASPCNTTLSESAQKIITLIKTSTAK